jgi:hypothetical protein
MKNKYSILTIICLFITIIMNTQQSLAQSPAAVKEIATAVEQLRKAIVNADSTMLDKLTADELSYGHSGGLLQNKQEFIHSITSGTSVFVSIDLTGQTIQIVDNTAIVRHILSAATNDKGKGAGTVKLGVLTVWIKNNAGQWHLLARQAVKV